MKEKVYFLTDAQFAEANKQSKGIQEYHVPETVPHILRTIGWKNWRGPCMQYRGHRLFLFMDSARQYYILAPTKEKPERGKPSQALLDELSEICGEKVEYEPKAQP